MPENILPDDVRQFLAIHIRSIEQLEILLLLGGSPERQWSVGEVYQTILSNEGSVQRTLDRLCQSGLAERLDQPTVTYKFYASTPQVTEVIAKLRELYKGSLVRIVQAIYGPRVSEIDEFAKAFKIRKDP